MAVKAKSQPKGNGAVEKAKAAKGLRLSASTDVRRNKRDVRVKNAIPQKVLVYATRLAEPPSISNEVPEAMPFATDDL